MKLSKGGLKRPEVAFTMIEIAFSLAIVAFALVAIMGVLPTGMTVQRDNREDTIINHDAAFWMEALRSGSKGIDDLTNYVEMITISDWDGVKESNAQIWTNWWDPSSSLPAGQERIVSGEQIVGLLTTPKYGTNSPAATNVSTKLVRAVVRALNGSAIEKETPPKKEFAFRYELQSEVVPLLPTPPGANTQTIPSFPRNVAYDFHDTSVSENLRNLRLTLRWPLFQQGTNWGGGLMSTDNARRNRRTVRGLVNGRLTTIPGTNYFFVQPNTYYVPPEDQSQPQS